ncbi:MAG TPA: hypothetical protein EYH31_11085, partial [Anaerolineae bacterium]|nr:hypothetical protein [Anaerolineae bacterium]
MICLWQRKDYGKMVKIRFRLIWAALLLLLLLGLLLTACGSKKSGDNSRGEGTTTPALAQQDTATPTRLAQTSLASPTRVPATKPRPTAVATQSGIPVGFTEEGDPFRGDPNAPVTIIEYSDYQCPFCGRHFRQTLPQIEETYVRTGQVKLVFRDFPLSIHPQAQKASEAAECAGAQSPQAYWALHDKLFETQREWSGQADHVDRFKQYARDLGLDGEAFDQCIDSDQYTDEIKKDMQAGIEAGVSGTPGFLINGYLLAGAYPFPEFQRLIDAFVRGEAPPTPTPKPDPFAADPKRPGYTIFGYAFQGSPDAPVKFIEVSDFECPFCAQFAREIFPRLEEKYIRPGKLQVVWIHYLGHQNSMIASEAAECA